MKSWICKSGHKNSEDDTHCFLCQSPNPQLSKDARKATVKASQALEKKKAAQTRAKEKSRLKARIKPVSDKQKEINFLLKICYEAMDEKAREGTGYLTCQAYPDQCEDMTIIDHSHIVSRDRCKKLGHPEWIYDPRNIVYHSRKAHVEWERFHDGKFMNHCNFPAMMAFIRERDPHDWDRRMEVVVALTRPKETV